MNTDRRFLFLVVLVVGCLAVRYSAYGETIVVNSDGTGDYPTIQAAIDASSNGDVIELANGVYTGVGNKNLDYNGKLICVRSASGNPESCILDCEKQGRGFYFHSGEDLSAKVEGLTIRDGCASSDSVPDHFNGHGGAVLLCEGGATFKHCRIIENDAGYAGGVSVVETKAVFHDCVIQDNVSRMLGGGMFCRQCSLHMYHCVISRNYSSIGGGGIYDIVSNMVLVDVTSTENVAAGFQGGGLFSAGTTLLAADCVFEKNCSKYSGGGIRIGGDPGNATFLNCQFIGNTAAWEGGGIYLFKNLGFVDLIDCVFMQNRAASGGGIGIFSDNPPIIENCTILNNFAEEDGGGIYILSPD